MYLISVPGCEVDAVWKCKNKKDDCEKAIDVATRTHPIRRGQGALSVQGEPVMRPRANGATSDNSQTSGAIVSKLLSFRFCTKIKI